MSSQGARRRWIVGLVLTAAASIVSVIVFGLGDEPPIAASSATQRPASADPVERGDIAQLSLVEPNAEPPTERALDAPAGAPSRDVAPDSGPQVILRGRIQSSRDDLARAALDISNSLVTRRRMPSFGSRSPATPESTTEPYTPQLSDPIHATADARGRFEVDVTEIARGAGQLIVFARHPALKTAITTVSIEPARRAKPGERVELTARLVMDTEMCRVRGRVTTATGEEVSSTIAAFELRNGVIVPSAEVVEDTGGHGEFDLELTAQPHVLLAFARDWRPATARIACTVGEALELSPIVLERGFSISGQALLGERPFASGMTVAASLQNLFGAHVSAGSIVFAWNGERFEWPQRQARANEIGMYEITALGDRHYDVQLLDAGSMSTAIFDTRSIVVRAPATDVVLSPRMCELHITVFKDGMPSSVRLTIRQWTGRSTERLTQFTSDTSGRASLWISPSSTAELIVDRGEAGERVFSLPDCPADSSAELRIDL